MRENGAYRQKALYHQFVAIPIYGKWILMDFRDTPVQDKAEWHGMLWQ